MYCAVCSFVPDQLSHVQIFFVFAESTMSGSDHLDEYSQPGSGSKEEGFESDVEDDIETNDPVGG